MNCNWQIFTLIVCALNFSFVAVGMHPEPLQCCKIEQIQQPEKNVVPWTVLLCKSENSHNIIVHGGVAKLFCIDRNAFLAIYSHVDKSKDFYFKVVNPEEEDFLAPVRGHKLSEQIFCLKSEK